VSYHSIWVLTLLVLMFTGSYTFMWMTLVQCCIHQVSFNSVTMLSSSFIWCVRCHICHGEKHAGARCMCLEWNSQLL